MNTHLLVIKHFLFGKSAIVFAVLVFCVLTCSLFGNLSLFLSLSRSLSLTYTSLFIRFLLCFLIHCCFLDHFSFEKQLIFHAGFLNYVFVCRFGHPQQQQQQKPGTFSSKVEPLFSCILFNHQCIHHFVFLSISTLQPTIPKQTPFGYSLINGKKR